MDIKKIIKKLDENGLTVRPSQLKMIQEAYSALSKQKIICIEAPTGTGKTLSYGIAAYLSKNPQQIIVISTATIALQEQLIGKDLPLLNRVLGTEIKAALAKGRRRYVCHARLYDDDQQTDFFSKEDHAHHLRTLLEDNHWDGDRDGLNQPLSDSEWLKYSTDSAGCSGKSCTFYAQCAFYKARQKWQEADFIITNHSLLLSDLILGSGMVLPELKKSIYIVDECHHFPNKALDLFSHSAPLLSSLDWINPFINCLQRALPKELIFPTQLKLFESRLQGLMKGLQTLQEFLQNNPDQFQDCPPQEKIWRCPENHKPVLEMAEVIFQDSDKFINEFQQLLSSLEEKLKLSVHEPQQKDQLSKLLAQLGFYYSRADKLNQTFQLFCQKRTDQEPPLARWFVNKAQGEYHCHAAPINVSQSLKNLFWDALSAGALLCSATVRAMGDFSDFRRKSGLNLHPKLVELTLDSCFNYQNSLLFAPKMCASPQGLEQSAHLAEVGRLLPELILPKAGTLVLFTSKYAMEQTFAQMPAEIKADILMQNKLAKKQLFQTHRQKIEANSRSIIFGLASLGEGIDLPAELCQHVIIHKLPFAVPTTPIEQTRHEWLSQNHRDPFEMATLPNVSVRLAQYVGRLIRRETDKGIVSILDKRIYTKAYGQRLLKSLPSFQVFLNIGLVEFKKNPLATHFFQEQ